eukprot:2105063-Pyramimonas_sp.AAC.1
MVVKRPSRRNALVGELEDRGRQHIGRRQVPLDVTEWPPLAGVQQFDGRLEVIAGHLELTAVD